MNRFLVFRKTIVVILLLSLTVGMFTFLSFASDTQILAESFEGAIWDFEKEEQDRLLNKSSKQFQDSHDIIADSDGYKSYFNKYKNNYNQLDNNSLVEQYLRYSVPSSADNSIDSAFPPIANQQGVGSCVPFAAIYYQFTYNANKLNNISSSNLANCYSPDWPYYSIAELEWDESTQSNNTIHGISGVETYEFTKSHGAVKWNELVPQASYDYTHPMPSDSAMLSALSTRISSWDYDEIETVNGNLPQNITNTFDLDYIKYRISQGEVYRVTSWSNWNYIDCNDYGRVITRFYKRPDNDPNPDESIHASGHSYCIVGYDDSVWVDVNGNNIQEPNETGAFKMANSWGSNWANSGYAWVLYDSLNLTSFISGNWEANLAGQRFPAFSMYDNTCNSFYYIEVENYKNYFVCKTDYQTVRKDYESTIGIIEYSIYCPQQNLTPTVKYTGVRTFSSYLPYSPVSDNISSFYSEVALGVQKNYNVPANSFSASLVDNKGNYIAGMTTDVGLSAEYSTDFLYFLKGDVNYSWTLNAADVNRIQQYIIGSRVFSDLQVFLADFNGDNKVNAKDVTALMNAITNG